MFCVVMLIWSHFADTLGRSLPPNSRTRMYMSADDLFSMLYNENPTWTPFAKSSSRGYARYNTNELREENMNTVRFILRSMEMPNTSFSL